jgi:membrane-bound metal-dependent hydrolase YbcI (DUF457 family)
MFIFAHVFCGALIGLLFWHLSNDRRAVPVCIVGAILPDLIDKPLSILFPEILGSGRTMGHTLLFFTILFVVGILIWHYRHTLLGVAFACALASHQVLDAMWTELASWLYPVLGPFPLFMIPDYTGYYLWLEISNPSEWVFGCASLIIITVWYMSIPENRVSFPNSRQKTTVRYSAALLLGIMGIYLLVFGLAAIPNAFFAPTYNSITDTMAGLVALSGAIVLFRW